MYKLLAIMAVAAVTASLDLISILTFAGYVLEADAKGVAFIAVAMFLPMSILGKLYTWMIVRFSAHNLMFATLVMRAFATGLMFWADTLPFLLALVAVRSAAIGLYYPIIAALAEQYKEHGRFAAWTNLTNSAARVAAPLVGGVLGVIFGEKFVFVLSAVVCLLVLPLVVLYKLSDKGHQSHGSETDVDENQANIALSVWLMLGVPIVGVSGLASMMSNLLPYTLNLFEVPKITLSIALSASAITGLLTNLAFVRWGKKPIGFPLNSLGVAWIGCCVGFLGLAYAVTQPQAYVTVPILFGILAMARTSYMVAILGYVFQQPKAHAARLAVFDQTLGSIAAMGVTLIGAFSLSEASPIPMMYAAVTIGAIACLVWWATFRIFGRRLNVAMKT